MSGEYAGGSQLIVPPAGGETRALGNQQRLARAAGEVAACEQRGDAAAQAGVDRGADGPELCALEHADDQTIAALFDRPAAKCFESHTLDPCLLANCSYNVAGAATPTGISGHADRLSGLRVASECALQV